MKKILILPLILITIYCSAQSEIIGNPIMLSNLEISQYTFPNSMNWREALNACKELGDGWKLPSKEQLDILYKNKDEIGGFVNDAYWSATKTGDYEAWRQYFSDGDQVLTPNYSVGYVRAIRVVNLDSIHGSQSSLPEINDDSIRNDPNKKIDLGYIELDSGQEITVSESDDEFGEEIDKELEEFLAGPKLIIQESDVKVSAYKFSTGIPFAGTIDSKSDKRFYSQKELRDLHKPAYIIGKPIKVGNFIVAQHEFPVKYIWKNAKAICATLGPGWRLPSKKELYILYQNKIKIGNFSKYGYWSSSEGNQEGVAWFQDFYLGGTNPSIANKNSPWGVRAVKSQ
ncbi:hypothetical protein ACST14_07075 [Aquirufa sp. A-Brett2-15D]